MKVIIAGGRDIFFYDALEKAIETCPFKDEITEVVYGGATGVDRMGKCWANEHSIPVKTFNADWASYGKAAGPIRNGQMAEYADALILIWDGKSSGSGDMLRRAKAKNLKIHEVVIGK